MPDSGAPALAPSSFGMMKHVSRKQGTLRWHFLLRASLDLHWMQTSVVVVQLKPLNSIPSGHLDSLMSTSSKPAVHSTATQQESCHLFDPGPMASKPGSRHDVSKPA